MVSIRILELADFAVLKQDFVIGHIRRDLSFELVGTASIAAHVEAIAMEVNQMDSR